MGQAKIVALPTRILAVVSRGVLKLRNGLYIYIYVYIYIYIYIYIYRERERGGPCEGQLLGPRDCKNKHRVEARSSFF